MSVIYDGMSDGATARLIDGLRSTTIEAMSRAARAEAALAASQARERRLRSNLKELLECVRLDRPGPEDQCECMVRADAALAEEVEP